MGVTKKFKRRSVDNHVSEYGYYLGSVPKILNMPRLLSDIFIVSLAARVTMIGFD